MYGGRIHEGFPLMLKLNRNNQCFKVHPTNLCALINAVDILGEKITLNVNENSTITYNLLRM